MRIFLFAILIAGCGASEAEDDPECRARCDGDVAIRCMEGTERHTDCAPLGNVCLAQNHTAGCVLDPPRTCDEHTALTCDDEGHAVRCESIAGGHYLARVDLPCPPITRMIATPEANCLLSLRGDAMRVACEEEEGDCTPIASGDLAPSEGVERFFLCTTMAFIDLFALAGPREILWGAQVESTRGTVSNRAEIVDALGDGTPSEVLVTTQGIDAVECEGEGDRIVEQTRVLTWSSDGLREIFLVEAAGCPRIECAPSVEVHPRRIEVTREGDGCVPSTTYNYEEPPSAFLESPQ